MNIDVLNMIIWLLTAFFFVLNTLVFAYGKRIIKQTKWVLDFIKLMLLIYLFKEMSNLTISMQYLLLGIISLFFIQILIRFFTGSEYKIYTENKEILVKSIDRSISSIMSIKAVREEKKNITLFVLEEGKNKIEVKEVESISGKKSYTIKFKKWIHHDLRNQILIQINEQLENYDDYTIDKEKVALHIISASLIMIILLFVTSYFVMEYKTINFEEEHIPTELYFEENNFSYTDEGMIHTIHERLQDEYNYKAKNITYDEVMKRTNYAFQYGKNGKTIYIGKEKMYIFVPNSEIRDKSPFHWLCWKLHSIYEKNEGTYYYVHHGDEVYKIIKNIVGES